MACELEAALDMPIAFKIFRNSVLTSEMTRELSFAEAVEHHWSQQEIGKEF